MLIQIALCLIASTSSTPTPSIEHASVREAPQLPPWLQGLPKDRKTPSEARCTDTEGVDLGEGIWLPQRRAQATLKRLDACRDLPRLCQRQIDRTWEVILSAMVNGAVDVALTDADVKRIEAEADQPQGHSTWTLVTWTVGGVAVGAVVTAVLLVAQ